MLECGASSPATLLDFCDVATVYERNTFLNVQPPPQLDLCRASSEPGRFSRVAGDLHVGTEEQDRAMPPVDPLLPPPPLELEAFETYDSFDEPVESTPASSGTAPQRSPGAVDCQSYVVQHGEHQFKGPFLTTPERRSCNCMPYQAFEGNLFYEWHDSVHQIPFSYSASQAVQGALPLAASMSADFALPLLLAARVPPPPSLPAPFVGAPSEPPNVTPYALGEADRPELEAPANDVSALEIARQPSGITCTVVGSIHHISWQVDAKKLESQDKQAVSPQFIIDLPELGPQPFKIALYPKIVNDSKRGASFKKAKGKGKVVLKCEAQLPQGIPEIVFRIGIGRGDKLRQPRGPVAHNFSEQSMRGLAKNEEEWDFNSAVDESGTFVVSLALAPSVTMRTTPNWVLRRSPMA